jgi:isopentenyl diphosphate isomerase/L-lactate dehydrogenase-like FMN-dependent dehydrogenase
VISPQNSRSTLAAHGQTRTLDDLSLAYGASAVLIGRPYIYGLSVSGADGVRSVIDILRTELEGAMAMTGRTRLNEIDRSVFWKSHDYRE